MTYEETINFLYNVTPAFEIIGEKAYKPGLERMFGMSEALGNPHTKFKSIHVGGTNGKGSVSNSLAAVLDAAGYKVGLFTSPHLVSFRERIRIGGRAISEEFVVQFVERVTDLIDQWKPSFFEITTLMAFTYFAEMKVDFAVIEVGMGGRLDSTNIITPLVSVITNIGLDHTQFLGNTIEEIAVEKAGIIKQNGHVVVGDAPTRIRKIFGAIAEERNASIEYSTMRKRFTKFEKQENGLWVVDKRYGAFQSVLSGAAQKANLLTTLTVLDYLKAQRLADISNEAVAKGFICIISKWHFYGRWQRVSRYPDIILDTAHNPDGFNSVLEQLRNEVYVRLHVVFGLVADKDWNKMIRQLPRTGIYYFVTPNGERALPAQLLQKETHSIGLRGKAYQTISEGLADAELNADSHDLILVFGSNYLVSEVISKHYPRLVSQSLE